MLKRLLMIGAPVAASISVGAGAGVGAASADPAVWGGPGTPPCAPPLSPQQQSRWSRGGPGRHATGKACRCRSVHRAASADDVVLRGSCSRSSSPWPPIHYCARRYHSSLSSNHDFRRLAGERTPCGPPTKGATQMKKITIAGAAVAAVAGPLVALGLSTGMASADAGDKGYGSQPGFEQATGQYGRCRCRLLRCVRHLRRRETRSGPSDSDRPPWSQRPPDGPE